MSTKIRSLSGFAAAFSAALLLFAASGCAHHYYEPRATHGWEVGRSSGAPAYGSRQARRDGVVLVFMQDIGAYAVSGYPQHYFYSSHYYRQRGAGWERAQRIRGPWLNVEVRALPRVLERYHQHLFSDHYRADQRRDERKEPKQRRERRRGSIDESTRQGDRAVEESQPKPWM